MMMTMISRHFSLLLLCMLMVACAPPPAPTVTPRPQPTRIPTRIVTLAPTATLAPSPTPTLPYALTPLLGTWLVDINLQLREGITFDDVRFSGTALVEVAFDATLSGTVEFYPTVLQPPCVTAALDSEPIRATLAGELQPTEDGSVVANLRFVPENAAQPTTLRLACVEFPEGIVLSDPIFWEALRAADLLTLRLPLRLGFQRQSSADLSGISGGALYGTLYAQVRVSR